MTGLRPNCGASPYNNRIELTARGWHAPCVAASGASLRMHGARQFPPAPSLPGRRLRPCSQLIRALYGRVCHEAPRRNSPEDFFGACCTRDEGRPLGVGLQGLIPNRRLRLWPNGLCRERVRKRRGQPVRCVLERRTNLNRCRGVESIETSSKPGCSSKPGIKLWGRPDYRPEGDRHKGDVNPVWALVRNVGTCASMLREKLEWPKPGE